MNEGIHLDLDTWIVPGQIRKANLCRGLGNRYTPAAANNAVIMSSTQLNTIVDSGGFTRLANMVQQANVCDQTEFMALGIISRDYSVAMKLKISGNTMK